MKQERIKLLPIEIDRLLGRLERRLGRLESFDFNAIKSVIESDNVFKYDWTDYADENTKIHYFYSVSYGLLAIKHYLKEDELQLELTN